MLRPQEEKQLNLAAGNPGVRSGVLRNLKEAQGSRPRESAHSPYSLVWGPGTASTLGITGWRVMGLVQALALPPKEN